MGNLPKNCFDCDRLYLIPIIFKDFGLTHFRCIFGETIARNIPIDRRPDYCKLKEFEDEKDNK